MSAVTLKDRSFLGTGWGFPPTFSRSGLCVEMVSDDEDIRESLRILFSTSLGERIMQPRYGCQLVEMVFQALTATLTTQLKALVLDAVLTWEPRINVEDVGVQPDASVAGLVTITVNYTIRATNTRSNYVYLFQQEATIPAPGP